MTKKAIKAPEAVDVASARKNLSALTQRAAGGETITITRYGKPIAQLIGTLGTNAALLTGVTVAPGNVQMTHEATDPAHRPVPEKLEVTSIELQRQAQAGRDALLRGSRRRPSE